MKLVKYCYHLPYLHIFLLFIFHYFGSVDGADALKTGANDILVVAQSDGTLKSTKIEAQVGKFNSFTSFFRSRRGQKVDVFINGQKMAFNQTLVVKGSGKISFNRRSADRFDIQNIEWQSISLNPGANAGVFKVESLGVTIPFNVFKFDQNSKLVLTDIDGTITESDTIGHVGYYVGFSAEHDDVVELFHNIARNGYQMVYLTARSMAIDSSTRDYLKNVEDKNGFKLPKGPLFMSPKPLAEALTEALSDPAPAKKSKILSILQLFDNKTKQNTIFFGAYGNSDSDMRAYQQAGLNSNLTYMINEDSILRRISDNHQTSYRNHLMNVNNIYPIVTTNEN